VCIKKTASLLDNEEECSDLAERRVVISIFRDIYLTTVANF